MAGAHPNERPLSSDAAAGLQTGMAIGIGVLFVGIGVIAWFPGLDLQLLGNPLPSVAKAFPAVGVLSVGVFLWFTRQRCDVYLTPHGLRIVRGTTEILVPMDQNQTVEREHNVRGPDRTNSISVTFRDRTPLGQSIRFVAPMVGAQHVVENCADARGSSHPSNVRRAL